MGGRKSKGKNGRYRDPRLVAELATQIELYRLSHTEIGVEAGVHRTFITNIFAGRRLMTKRVVQAIRALVRRRCREIMAAEMRSLR